MKNRGDRGDDCNVNAYNCAFHKMAEQCGNQSAEIVCQSVDCDFKYDYECPTLLDCSPYNSSPWVENF